MKKKSKRIKVADKIIEAEICDSFFSKARGLMFRKNPKPLLFIFKNATRQPIHSFFCKPFKAIWLKDGKPVDKKIIRPFSLFVKPSSSFTELLEIPMNGDKESRILDENRKI